MMSKGPGLSKKMLKKRSKICTIGIFGATGTSGTFIGGGEAEVIPFEGLWRGASVAFR